LSDGDYLGAGTSSSSFIRNTVVMPRAGTITSITFHIREHASDKSHIAEIYIQPIATFGGGAIATGQLVTQAIGTPCINGAVAVVVAQCDLVSVRIKGVDHTHSMSGGACVTIAYTPIKN
jgi:uncharacterized membrane protein YoaK (UPF0700 family)